MLIFDTQKHNRKPIISGSAPIKPDDFPENSCKISRKIRATFLRFWLANWSTCELPRGSVVLLRGRGAACCLHVRVAHWGTHQTELSVAPACSRIHRVRQLLCTNTKVTFCQFCTLLHTISHHFCHCYPHCEGR